MPRLTPDRLAAALKKGSPAPVWYLHGSETILKDEAIRTLIDGILDPSLRDFNLDLHSAQQLAPDGIPAAGAHRQSVDQQMSVGSVAGRHGHALQCSTVPGARTADPTPHRPLTQGNRKLAAALRSTCPRVGITDTAPPPAPPRG